MIRLMLSRSLGMGLVLLLVSACGPAGAAPTGAAPTGAAPTGAAPTGAAPTTAIRPTEGVVFEATAQVSTAIAEPNFITALPPDYTPPPTEIPPTETPIPTVAGGLGPTELKYRVLDAFPDFFFCDPDFYPVARAEEIDLALQRFPAIQANAEGFQAILAHTGLAGQQSFSNDQKLQVYRDHKKLDAIRFELAKNVYGFQIQSAKTEGEGELIQGVIDGQGTITIQQRTPSIVTCPICLAAGTQIDTPSGPIPVENLRVGMLVWTLDTAGERVAQPVLQVGRTTVPANHRVVHLVLDDGRQLWVSPGHPTANGRRVGLLRPGESLNGAQVLSAGLVPYAGGFTYDLLPAGATGLYWANGILMGSTLF